MKKYNGKKFFTSSGYVFLRLLYSLQLTRSFLINGFLYNIEYIVKKLWYFCYVSMIFIKYLFSIPTRSFLYGKWCLIIQKPLGERDFQVVIKWIYKLILMVRTYAEK